MEITEYWGPVAWVMIGRVVSIDVAPPTEMEANGPKYLAIHGANKSVITSRMILARRAIVPNSAPLICVMNMEERE